MKKLFTWQLLVALFLTISLSTFGQEVLVNGDFEAWDDPNTPTGWDKVENVDQESAAANVHGGSFSVKHTGGTKDLGQYVPVTAGESYTITLWYKVVENDGTDARIWSYWKSGGSNIYDNGDELRGPNNSYLPNNGGAWSTYSVTLDAPATADELYLEVRTYSGAVTYWDDFSVFHNAPASVAAPTFSPDAGTYYSAQDVSMSTTTAGADIYYTTDGTDPDNTSTLYTGAVNIATTTTLKAIAWDGVDYSSISTGVFTIASAVQVADIATLRAGTQDGTVYELTGEAFLTYQQSFGNKKWIQDATAGIEIIDFAGNITTSYNIYDGITGIFGTLDTYNGMLQFEPVLDPGAASSSGNTVSPLLISADDFNNNHEMYEARLVQIYNLTFEDAGSTFSTGSNYTTTDHLGTDVLFRTNFYDASYIGTTIPSGAQDIVGIVSEYNGTPQFTARETTDIVPHVPVIPVSSTGIIIGGLLIALVLVVRRGRLF